MFQLPNEIQENIFSFDSTYQDKWKQVMYQLKQCIYCGAFEREEFICEEHDSNHKTIQKNFSCYKFCSFECIEDSFSFELENKYDLYQQFSPTIFYLR